MNGKSEGQGMSRTAGRRKDVVALLRNAVGFAFVPMLGAVTPLLIVPIIATTSGASGWAAIAIGQSVGMAGAVIVELGWALTGPQQIARTPEADRPHLFAHAMATKCLVLAAISLPAIAAASLLALEHRLAAVLAAFAGLVGGLTTNWYFIGLGKPSGLVYFDAVPKLLGTLASSALLLVGAPLWSYGATMIAALSTGTILASVRAGGDWLRAADLSATWGTIRYQRVALGARVASTTYISLSVVLIRLAAPAAVAPFAAADRIVRMGLSVLQALPSALQRYVGVASSGVGLRKRTMHVLTAQVLLGVAAATFTVAALVPAGDLLFRGTVDLSGLAVPGALVVGFTCASRGTGLGLVAVKRVGWIASSAVAGGIAGAALIVALGSLHGAAGAFWGMATTEALVFVIQLVGLMLAFRRGQRTIDS